MTTPAEMTDEDVMGLAATVVLGAVARLVKADVRPATAFRQVAVQLVEEYYGPKVLNELGVPERTRVRWHADLEAALPQGLSGEDEPPSEDFLRWYGEMTDRLAWRRERAVAREPK